MKHNPFTVKKRYFFYAFNTSQILLLTTKVYILVDGTIFEEELDWPRVILNIIVLPTDYMRNFLIFRFLDFDFDASFNYYSRWRKISSVIIALLSCCFSLVISGLNLYATFGLVPDEKLIENSLVILTYLPIAATCWRRVNTTPPISDFYWHLENGNNAYWV